MSYKHLTTEVSCNALLKGGNFCSARVIYLKEVHEGSLREWLTSLGWKIHKSSDTGLETDVCPKCVRAYQVKVKEQQEQWATKSSRCTSS